MAERSLLASTSVVKEIKGLYREYGSCFGDFFPELGGTNKFKKIDVYPGILTHTGMQSSILVAL